MNVAYLDPPYSRYFHVLARRLAQQTGGDVVALLSCPAYRMYTGDDRTQVWRPGPTQRAYPVPGAFARAEWAARGGAGLAQAFSHAVDWFRAQFEAERVDVCLVFSDARPFSQAARVAAEQLGIVCVFFERGAYRFRTASLSTQGLNARFDLATARRAGQVTGLASPPPRRASEPWLRLRFLRFMLRNAVACALEPGARPMQHKSYHFFNYVRIALRQLRAEHPLSRRPDATPSVEADGPLVLLPLQLPTDSQFMLHSPFRNNQELIDFVVAETRAVLPTAQVLVKRHPMDVRRYRLPAGAREIRGSLAPHYASAAFVVCLNSTVGFEAAAQGKTVLCLGDSFYTGHPHVLRPSRADFGAAVRHAAERGDDPEAGAALREEVLRHYQSPGDVWAYTERDLAETAAIVLQQVARARGAVAARRASGAAAVHRPGAGLSAGPAGA